MLGRKIYFRVNRGQNIYFQPQQIFENAKKKEEKKKGGGKCEGLVEGAGHGYVLHNVLQSRGGRTWLCFAYNVLLTTST